MVMHEALRRFLRDPRVLFDRLYFSIRGIRVMHMKEMHENDKGTLSALPKLAAKHIPVIAVETYVGASAQEHDTEELAALFQKYGSDKSSRHNYHLVYGHLLKGKRRQPLRLLEIGLGTNNTSVPSNMGKYGKPGAAERAFRDWAERAEIYGADIDKGILFSEERIETFFVDQTKPETLQSLVSHFQPHSFDLIIDDGLHNTWANLNTLEAALLLVKPDGAVVIEDIVDRYLPTWQIAAALLSDRYHCELVKCKTESVFIVRPK